MVTLVQQYGQKLKLKLVINISYGQCAPFLCLSSPTNQEIQSSKFSISRSTTLHPMVRDISPKKSRDFVPANHILFCSQEIPIIPSVLLISSYWASLSGRAGTSDKHRPQARPCPPARPWPETVARAGERWWVL